MCMCLFVNITMFDLYSVICFSCFYWENPSKTHRENPFLMSVRAQWKFRWPAHAYLLPTQWRFKYFEARNGKLWRDFFYNCVPVFAWGAITDSDKVSLYLLIHVKIMQFHEGCNGIYFLSIFSMLILRPILISRRDM